MKPYTIRVLSMGETTVPCAELYWMTRLVGWEPLTFWAVLVEHDERRILINTGFPRDYSALHKHWTTWAKAATDEEGHVPVVRDEHWIVNALKNAGTRPEDIDHVLITPLTSYATGGLDQFPTSRIWISEHGWTDFHHPDPEIPQLPRNIVFPDHVLQWLEAGRQRLNLIPDEDKELFPSIRSWFCGAHHRSSMAFVIETAQGRVGVTDAVFKYRNYEEKIPLGLSESLEEHYRLYAKLKRETDLIIPLYDPLVVKRHPKGVIS